MAGIMMGWLKKQQARPGNAAGSLKHPGIFSLDAFKAGINFSKSIDPYTGNPSGFDARSVNILLIVVIILLAVYMLVNVLNSVRLLQKDVRSVITVPESSQRTFAPLASPLKEENYYVEKATARDIFSVGPKKQSTEERAVQLGPSQALIEATKDLKLVGIAWPNGPESEPDVMIEDTKSQSTFILKKGETLENGVVIKAIQKDVVILRYKEEEFELK